MTGSSSRGQQQRADVLPPGRREQLAIAVVEDAGVEHAGVEALADDRRKPGPVGALDPAVVIALLDHTDGEPHRVGSGHERGVRDERPDVHRFPPPGDPWGGVVDEPVLHDGGPLLEGLEVLRRLDPGQLLHALAAAAGPPHSQDPGGDVPDQVPESRVLNAVQASGPRRRAEVDSAHWPPRPCPAPAASCSACRASWSACQPSAAPHAWVITAASLRPSATGKGWRPTGPRPQDVPAASSPPYLSVTRPLA